MSGRPISEGGGHQQSDLSHPSEGDDHIVKPLDHPDGIGMTLLSFRRWAMMVGRIQSHTYDSGFIITHAHHAGMMHQVPRLRHEPMALGQVQLMPYWVAVRRLHLIGGGVLSCKHFRTGYTTPKYLPCSFAL